MELSVRGDFFFLTLDEQPLKPITRVLDDVEMTVTFYGGVIFAITSIVFDKNTDLERLKNYLIEFGLYELIRTIEFREEDYSTDFDGEKIEAQVQFLKEFLSGVSLRLCGGMIHPSISQLNIEELCFWFPKAKDLLSLFSPTSMVCLNEMIPDHWHQCVRKIRCAKGDEDVSEFENLESIGVKIVNNTKIFSTLPPSVRKVTFHTGFTDASSIGLLYKRGVRKIKYRDKSVTLNEEYPPDLVIIAGEKVIHGKQNTSLLENM